MKYIKSRTINYENLKTMCWCIKLSGTIVINLMKRTWNECVDFLYKIRMKFQSENVYQCSSLQTDGKRDSVAGR